MKRVLFVQPILPHYRKDIIRGLLKVSEFECFFIASDKYLNNSSVRFDSTNVVNDLPYRKWSLGFKKFYWLHKSLKEINEKDPDIIVLTGFNPYMVHIIFAYFKYYFFSSTKVMWWSHGNLGIQGAVGKKIRAFFYKNSNGVLAYSAAGKRNLQTLGIHEDKIKVINNSIPKKDYGFLRLDVLEAKKKQNNQTLNLIVVGKLTAVKKISLLVEAAEKLRNQYVQVKVAIVGNGYDMNILENLVKEKQLEDVVTLHGPMYGEELDALMLRSDMYVLPGAVGLSIVHAFSYGLPIITTSNIDVHRPEIELFAEGKTGMLYQGFDVDDMVDKILDLKEKLSESRVSIATSCIESIKEHGYLPQVMIENIKNHVLTLANN